MRYAAEQAIELQFGGMEHNQEEEAVEYEEYRVWKKNAPYLYDLVIAHELEDWWSLTAQWLPNCDVTEERLIHRVILGTVADASSPNYLLVAKVFMPLPRQFEEGQRYGEIKDDTRRVQIETRILHQGDINRARYCPHRYNLIATKTACGEVHLFDYAKRPSKSSKTVADPDLRLIGHDCQGYGLSWNQRRQGLLLSAGYDKKIILWDVETASQLYGKLPASRQFNFHESQVEDVQWHPYQGQLFSSVGSDGNLALWDLRKEAGPFFANKAHEGAAYTVDWNPFNQYLYATGGADRAVRVWDLRNTCKPLKTLAFHQGEVFKVAWSPQFQSVLASSSADRRINILDLSREQGCELIFAHAGHRSKVTDFDWNINEPLTVVSTEECNLFQVWQMTSSAI